jgi:hypothetical protein
MYLESQAQLGDIPWPRKGSAGVFLDSAISRGLSRAASVGRRHPPLG